MHYRAGVVMVRADGSPPRQNQRRTRWLRTTLREARTAPTVLVVLVCLVVGVPLTIILTPDQQVTVTAGQRLSVGARTPELSLSGPAQLVQLGNTAFDVNALHVYGPLRPRLTLEPVPRGITLDATAQTPTAAATAISGGFVRWYGWATLILLGFALAATAVVGCVRMLRTLRRLDTGHLTPGTAVVLWRRSAGQLTGSAAVAVVVTMVAWAGAGALAYGGAVEGLRQVRSLSDLVGTYHLTPSPVGPEVSGFAGAVIGDSRAARLGGPPAAGATEDDAACFRSVDSLAVELGSLTGTQVRNLACAGASIANGLRGPQSSGGHIVPPQVGLLRQLEDLQFVVVVVGPNDLYWADFLRYCYGAADCADNLSQGVFSQRLAEFDRDYGELLRDLNDLPGGPQVIVMASYDVFPPDADCPDSQGPDGVPGLSPENLQLLADLNRRLNDVLRTGAEEYDFSMATPRLIGLCARFNPALGPDLQGLDDSDPFHPTAVGIVRMAAAVAQVLDPEPQPE